METPQCQKMISTTCQAPYNEIVKDLTKTSTSILGKTPMGRKKLGHVRDDLNIKVAKSTHGFGSK